MRPLPATAVALTLLTTLGFAACSDTSTDTTTSSNPPIEEPATTGSLPEEQTTPVEPIAPVEEPGVVTEPPVEEGTTQ